ncbi:MAG: NADH-quinone oxidoreductase subunit C [Verrucomicrobia bacterium]|nr:NADH-quinone oxidoreductase subunit C [Verrucomicrobiota bacterium]
MAAKLQARFNGLVSAPTEFRGELTQTVDDPERIAEVCQFAKTDLGFDVLLDLSSVDEYDTPPRFTLVYELYSLRLQTHLRLTTRVGDTPGELPTVSSVWRTADWHEREVFDMMGIRFRGHPDLRRILMWDGYPHFPLRKDFPLAGKPTELPGAPFTQAAPMDGGPFVSPTGARNAIAREPRARAPEPRD